MCGLRIYGYEGFEDHRRQCFVVVSERGTLAVQSYGDWL